MKKSYVANYVEHATVPVNIFYFYTNNTGIFIFTEHNIMQKDTNDMKAMTMINHCFLPASKNKLHLLFPIFIFYPSLF